MLSARDLFFQRSFEDVGVKEICDEAGVQKGSFYHFFASKQALTLAVLDEFLLELKHEIFEKAFLPHLTPLQQLQRYVEAVYQFQLKTQQQSGKTLGCPYGNMAAEMSTRDEPIRHKIEKVFAEVMSAIQATLDQAVAQGEITALDTEATAIAMFSFMEGLMLMAKNQNDPELIRRIGPGMLSLRVELKTP